MTRNLRARLADIEAQGLTIVDLQYGRHMKVSISAADGRTMLLILSKNPERSSRPLGESGGSQLRRFARQEAKP